METKTLHGLKLLGDQGQVEAVFSTLNVKDADGDVTLPGAFTDGQQVRISDWNHSSWGSALPVGRGRIEMRADRAVMAGQFFLNTSAGRDAYETVKGLAGDDQGAADLTKWSYGYDVLDASPGEVGGEKVRLLKSLNVHEVAPVLVPAGVGTGTLSVKSGEEPGWLDGALADVKAGRVLSAANRGRLSALVDALREAGVSLEALLDETDPSKSTTEHDDAMSALHTVQLAEIARSLQST